jgi:hypothetical protein
LIPVAREAFTCTNVDVVGIVYTANGGQLPLDCLSERIEPTEPVSDLVPTGESLAHQLQPLDSTRPESGTQIVNRTAIPPWIETRIMDTSARGASSPRKGPCPPVTTDLKDTNLLSA